MLAVECPSHAQRPRQEDRHRRRRVDLPAHRARARPADFVAPKEIHDLREFTRYRRTLAEERTREAQRLDKVLQDAGVKLSSVASDVLGASSRAMLAALVEGTRDPAALADLAKGKLRSKLPALRTALEGRFGPRHAVLVSEILSHLDYLDEAIGRMTSAIEEAIAPFAEARDRLCSIPGIDRRRCMHPYLDIRTTTRSYSAGGSCEPLRAQLHPGGVRVLRQLGSDTADADCPVGLAEPLRIELANNSHDMTIEQWRVVLGDRLFRGLEDLGQSTERRSWIDVESFG